MEMSQVFMIVGFLLASYSIVANDAIQTLGTFLASNAKRPWWVLWIFACSILVAVLVIGWYRYGGDVSYGRLSKIPEPEEFTWIYVVPPIVLLFLTRFGIPVSTTFLILTIFAQKALPNMLVKSFAGYAVAFTVAILSYRFLTAKLEQRFAATKDEPMPRHWVIMQWCSTGFLWSQWLIQDLANIFVFLPRELSVQKLVMAIFVMLVLHAVIFYRHGGVIQKIVTSKSNTSDIRSATIIDFIYGMVLLVFKNASQMPMSTTWVFLGLLAGREIGLRIAAGGDLKETWQLVGRDVLKALTGLVVSVLLAFGLPWLASL